MQFDMNYGVIKLEEPAWTVTETGTTGPWWRREKVYSASNGIVEISGMNAAMVAQLPRVVNP